jgi:aryl-alcohol dehydrogenase-like predicted oxidoreductase
MQEMEYRTLGRHGVKVSRLCLGTMMFGGPTSEEESIRIIHRALDLGINFIDTADMYTGGASERITGKAIRDRRDQVVLATKVRYPVGDGPNDSGLSRYHIFNAVEASLRRLGTDHIDLYYLHLPDYETPLEESLSAMDDLVRQGKVRYIGCSNFYAWQICKGLWISDRRGWAPFACVQPLYNIVNRDAEVEVLPLCAEEGLGVVTYSPLARGVLSGKYLPGGDLPSDSRAARGDKRLRETELRQESFEVAARLKELASAKGCTLTQLALAWVMGNPIVTCPILGPRTMEQFEDNIGCLSVTITPEDEATIDALVPRGEHTGYGFTDPQYPVRGRPVAA